MYTFKVDDLITMNEKLKAFAEFLRSRDISEEDAFFCRLVSCELISNVIIHGGESADFEGDLADGGVYITVSAKSFDGVNTAPPVPDVLAESGRGMYIVRSICAGDIQQFDGGLRVFYKTKK